MQGFSDRCNSACEIFGMTGRGLLGFGFRDSPSTVKDSWEELGQGVDGFSELCFPLWRFLSIQAAHLASLRR